MFHSGATGKGLKVALSCLISQGVLKTVRVYSLSMCPPMGSTVMCISSERAKLPFLSMFNCSEYAFVSEIPSSPRLAKAAHFPYQGRSPPGLASKCAFIFDLGILPFTLSIYFMTIASSATMLHKFIDT